MRERQVGAARQLTAQFQGRSLGDIGWLRRHGAWLGKTFLACVRWRAVPMIGGWDELCV